MRFTSLLGFSLSAFATSGAALNDLDASVWKSLQGEQSSTSNVFERESRNRPVKRADGWNPPANLAAPLKQVWDHVEKTYDGGVKGNINWTWQQIMANKGFLNVCVRWDSKSKVTAAEREKIITAYKAQYQKWFKWLYGFDGFPYSNIDINIVGWAVRDKSLFEGTSNYPVYSNTKDPDGVPACDTGCSRDAHMDGDYSKCNGGFDKHFDQSLWLTDGLEGGFGYSWGQQVGKEYMLNNLGSANIHILLHEMGHGFGLDDFYDWTPTGISKFIMLAGASMEITDFDGWMFRNWWYELNKIHKWASGSSASPSAAGSPAVKPITTKAAVAPAPTKAAVTSTKSVVKPTANAGSSGALAQKWQQCGGSGYTGPTACVSGSTCVKTNQYYSQCL